MFRAAAPLRIRERAARLFRLTVVVGFLFLMLMGMMAGSPVARADAPGGDVTDSFVRLVDIAKPAIVRIITIIDGQLTVHFSNGQVVTFPQNDPNGYPLGLSGTGTFISAHGDILTADHVINPPHDASLDQYLQQTAAQDVATYYDANVSPGSPLSADQVTQELASGQLPSSTKYDTPSSEAYLSTDYTGPLSATNAQNLPAYVHSQVDRIEAQSSFNDRDVAIIHVSNMDDMPVVPIGDSTTVQEQDELRIIGFPGNGDVNMDNISQLLTSSVNQIFVSSIKTTNTGAPLIQVSGNVEHGDSGGPALNSSGQIVGVVSFGTDQPGNTSFLQASASASLLVQQAGVNTTPGPFQKAWSQAFNDYASTTAGHWHKAQQEFQQIATQYPNFKAVAPYLAYATQQAKTEKVSSSATPTTTQGALGQTNPQLNMWIIVGAIVVLLLVVLLIMIIVIQRRRGSSVPTSTAVAGSLADKSAVGAINRPLQGSPPFAAPSVMPGSQQPAAPGTYGNRPPDALTAFGAPPTPWPNQVQGQSIPAPSQPFSGDQTWVAPKPAVQPNLPGNPSVPLNPNNANNSGALVVWPCGHMNRPVARFCSVCGEPAPIRPVNRQYEQ
jgi:S1-C subfamily serine protease